MLGIFLPVTLIFRGDTLLKTNSSPLKSYGIPKGQDRLPSTIFEHRLQGYMPDVFCQKNSQK